MNDLDILVASEQELMLYTVNCGYDSPQSARVWQLRPEMPKVCILKYSANRFMFRSKAWHLACRMRYKMIPLEKLFPSSDDVECMIGMWFKLKEVA